MADSGRQQQKLVERLRAFAKVEGNRVCADCTEKVTAFAESLFLSG